ncbi:hypothetical protein [Flavobacterium chungangense]|uniref:Uncharacterized protein n=1 Tax=Flavobacterium chungangense TaxID=554283 RepID=A0A6V6ZDJ4_9FLAO|nr:hypothetical protein [Flavobacterium chungangense]CAD0009850.1 hypothetical protein FLACHUCJ7_04490 [Flavobacterium chungangense]
MFGLFKRTKIENKEIQLLRNTIIKLPVPYSDLINQIDDGLFKGVLTNASDIPGYIAFTFNPEVLRKYDQENEKDFKLYNIKVYDKKTLVYLPYEIYILSGTISGYSLGGGKKNDIDIEKIDISNFKKEFIGISDYNRIENLLNKKEKTLLNPSEVYSVFLNEKEYFHIKDLSDGDFIGIDSNKNVYKITHDPFIIEKINESIESILSK